jgi:hypothetical protein
LVKLAETIQEERDHALDKVDKASVSGGADTDLWGNEYTPALKGNFVPLGSTATDSKTIAVAVEILSGAKHGIDYRKIEAQNPVFVQIKTIKDRLNELAKRYALNHARRHGLNRPDFKVLHKMYIENGGKQMDIETIEELKKRELFYISQLRNN